MNFLLHLITIISISLPLTLSHNLLFGRGKIFHFGPVGIAVASAYATYLTLQMTGNAATGIATGFLVALLGSLLFFSLALRIEPDSLGILTIALHLAILTVILNEEWTRGALGLPYIPRLLQLENPQHFAIGTVAVAALWYLFIRWIDRSALGRALAALAEDAQYAQAQGIHRSHVLLITFLIAGMGAAMSGILIPQYLRLLHPSDFGFPALVVLIMTIVAGKPGSPLGVTLAAILLTALREGLRFLPLPLSAIGPLRLLLFGGILLSAVYLRRDTLFPKPRTI